MPNRGDLNRSVPNEVSSNRERSTSNDRQNSGINQQELEQENWSDAQEEQANEDKPRLNDRGLKSINHQLNDIHLNSSSVDDECKTIDTSSTHCLVRQPYEFCSRTCLTDIDTEAGILILHEAVFNDNTEWIHQILNNQDLAQQCVNKKDKHGNTPLHLVCMLGRSKEIVKALLEKGASIDCKNLNRWTPFHEACSYGNRDIITLMTKQLESDLYNALNKNKLSENLGRTKNYCISLRWEFQSWVPLIARVLPNDLCKITKHGRYIRIDTGLFDYGMDHKWMSGNSRDCCLIYNHNLEKKWAVLNNKLKKYQYLEAQNIEKRSIEDKVDECMSIDVMDFELKSNDIQLTRSTSGWIWKADKTDQIGDYQAAIYNFDNVFLVTRKRREHLTDEDMKRNKMAYKAAISIFKFGKKPVLEDLGPANEDGDDEENINDNYSDRQRDDQPDEVEHRPSLAPPPACNITWEEYLGSKPGEFPILGRKHKCKTSTTAFKASVAMSKQFPIDKNEFLDLLSIVPMKLFKKLKEFIEMRLPEGFPIRLDIPVFPPFLTSRITFEDFAFIEGPMDESLFTIPKDYKEDPNLYPVLAGQRRN